MTPEATDLVARLRERAAYDKKFYPPADPMWTQAATLIEAQAAEIEGLRAALEPFVQHGRACGALADADNGPFWIMTDTGHRDIPAEDFRRAFFLASRTERSDG